MATPMPRTRRFYIDVPTARGMRRVYGATRITTAFKANSLLRSTAVPYRRTAAIEVTS